MHGDLIKSLPSILVNLCLPLLNWSILSRLVTIHFRWLCIIFILLTWGIIPWVLNKLHAKTISKSCALSQEGLWEGDWGFGAGAQTPRQFDWQLVVRIAVPLDFVEFGGDKDLIFGKGFEAVFRNIDEEWARSSDLLWWLGNFFTFFHLSYLIY